MNCRSQVIKIGNPYNAGVQVNSISVNLFSNLRFQPDEMIVKQIMYSGDNIAGSSYQLWTDLVNDGFLGIVNGGGTTNIGSNTYVNLVYDLRNRNISGTTFNFQLQALTLGISVGAPVVGAAGAIGSWGLMLEFRKYY